MSAEEASADQAWAQLADVVEGERERQMVARYKELASVAEEERRKRLRAMAEAEYALPDEKLRPFTLSRIQVWLKMDFEVAKTVAASYEAVMNEMSARVAMRRVGIVQTLTRQLPAQDEERLRALVPGVFKDEPLARALFTRQPTEQASPPPVKERRWAFWKKK